MSKTLTTIDNIPATVFAFAEAWGTLFMESNTDWNDDYFQEDSWHYFEGYDLNLVCEDGQLTICAYPSYIDDNGDIKTELSEFSYVFAEPKP